MKILYEYNCTYASSRNLIQEKDELHLATFRKKYLSHHGRLLIREENQIHFFTFYPENSQIGRGISSSPIHTIIFKNSIIEVKTVNSIYEFIDVSETDVLKEDESRPYIHTGY